MAESKTLDGLESVTGIRVVVPGDPVAQLRTRAIAAWGTVRVHQHPRVRRWKARAAAAYVAAVAEAGLSQPAMSGALEVDIVALFRRPGSMPRSAPVTRHPRTVRPDWDNLAKIAVDAGNGILWRDDAQIVLATVRKLYVAEGEEAHVEMTVRRLEGGLT